MQQAALAAPELQATHVVDGRGGGVRGCGGAKALAELNARQPSVAALRNKKTLFLSVLAHSS